MKPTNKILLALLLGLGLVTSGCKKYLEAKSDDKLVVPKTIADLQGLLDDAVTMNYPVTPSYGETSADDYFVSAVNLTRLGAIAKNVYSWKPININYGNDWSKSYLPVYNSNLALELLGGVERNASNALAWDNVKGSALFFRSYYYLLLTAQYGLAYDEQTSDTDLGIVIRESSNFNEVSVRSSVKACYQRVIRDLEQAIPLLPDFPLHSLRPSKAAAYALLSRTGLYMRDYAMGLKYADLAIALKPELMDYNGDSDLNALSANIPVKKFNKETIFYTEMFAGFALHSPTYALIDTALYASYALNDLRRTAFFRMVGGYPVFKGSYSAHASTLFSGLTTAEQYLNRSECKAYIGDLIGAMADLNLLSKKRWRSIAPFPAFNIADKNLALKQIRLERRKEMLMRGTRWADIKRQNKEGANITPIHKLDGQEISLNPASRFYALPLPTDVITISGIPQNQ
ncbi:RagB/SusD family nutrient uptake outer membrane protein [Pedobacter sp. Leaf250]|uniref:RagB/SusD family nutrient uptake outer membrane protein n=1 Tax=Pedobacter sp. Leaf250 TaxID=2876559 RepID=UPI001E287539|nr:RagB/SusD family nutrient uptake outer membrane protein [Pedobacter sp. Leaf250]